MSHNWSQATHPYGPGMMHVGHSAPRADNGLGVWGQVAAFAGSVLAPKVGDWIGGDGDIPNDVYYSQAKLGVIYCDGPWKVDALRLALENNPSDPIQAQINQYFVSGVSQRDADKWARFGRPRTPLEKAGALVAEAHGGSDCQGGPESSIASGLVSRMIEVERQRRRSPVGTVADLATVATTPVLAGVIPGGISPLVLAGAGAVLFFVLRR